MQETLIDKEDLFTVLTFEPTQYTRLIVRGDGPRGIHLVESPTTGKLLCYNEDTDTWSYWK